MSFALHCRPVRGIWLLLITGIALAASGLIAPTEASAFHRVVVEQVPGTILDAQAGQILFLDRSNVLSVEDRQTHAVTQIPAVSGKHPLYGYLSPHGAIFVSIGADATTAELDEWRDGSLIKLLGSINSTYSLVVKGKYAIYSGADTCCSYSLFQRDLDLGVTTLVATNAGNIDDDVAANGDVAYWIYQTPPGYQIFRYRDGVSVQLTSDTTLWNTDPLTDGINIAYRKITPGNCCGGQTGSVAVYTASGETVLDSFRNSWPNPYTDYQVAGGYVAYTKVGPSGELQVWERDPSAAIGQVSPSGRSAQILAMDPGGGVMFQQVPQPTPSPLSDYLYLGRMNSTPTNLGTYGGSLGTRGLPGHGNFVFWQQGNWYEAARGTLFRFVPDPGYPRPRGAAPVRASLVVAYKPCMSPNDEHGAPLAFASCNPPQMDSNFLTVGTPDSNGLPARSEGYVRLDALPGNPATPDNEADLKLSLDVTDVFWKNLTQYQGSLEAFVPVRHTDENNALLHSGDIDYVDMNVSPTEIHTTADHGLEDGAMVLIGGKNPCFSGTDTITVTGARTFTLDSPRPGYSCSGTVTGGTWSEQGFRNPGPGTFNAPLSFTTAPCVAPPDTTIGSECSATTTANALVPGTVQEGQRSIWQFGRVQVFDGGASGVAGSSDATLFMRQGVFVP
jgi:hypothetical protein